MSDHDPLCSTKFRQAATCRECHLIARVRNDELDRWLNSDLLDRALDQARMDVLAHAEAVAARLVEVICEQEADLAAHEAAASNLLTVWRKTRAQRDAALAERAKAPRHSTGTDTGGPCCECCYDVYRLRAERDRLRAEVARLQVDLDHAWAVANGEARR